MLVSLNPESLDITRAICTEDSYLGDDIIKYKEKHKNHFHIEFQEVNFRKRRVSKVDSAPTLFDGPYFAPKTKRTFEVVNKLPGVVYRAYNKDTGKNIGLRGSEKFSFDGEVLTLKESLVDGKRGSIKYNIGLIAINKESRACRKYSPARPVYVAPDLVGRWGETFRPLSSSQCEQYTGNEDCSIGLRSYIEITSMDTLVKIGGVYVFHLSGYRYYEHIRADGDSYAIKSVKKHFFNSDLGNHKTGSLYIYGEDLVKFNTHGEDSEHEYTWSCKRYYYEYDEIGCDLLAPDTGIKRSP